MNFLTMQQELSDRLAVYDESVSTDATKLKRWLNMGQQYICGKMNWPFMLAYETIQTVTDITTGTVSINAAATALTFSSAPSVSVANRYIQLSTSDDWYKISSHTAGETSATLETAYVGTSNLSGGTYTVRKLLYGTSSSSPLDSIFDMKRTVSAGRLKSLTQLEGDFFLSLYRDAGTPYNYIMGPLDSSGNLQFSLVNPPNAVINLLVRGIKKLSDLSADTDTAIIPVRWHDAMVDMGAFYGFLGIKDVQAKICFDLAVVKIADMERVFDPDLGRHRVMNPIDAEYDYGPAYTLPSEYGRLS